MTEDTTEREPDRVYDPDDADNTYDWADRDGAADDADMDVGEVKRFATLIKGPDWFAAIVPLSFDEDGEPDETETQWFESEEAAKAAVAKAMEEAEGRRKPRSASS